MNAISDSPPGEGSAPGGAIDRSGLRDRVYSVLLELILDGVVSPGERLTIDALAKRLRLSPTPVREALVQLERTGLVTREALKGYRVAPPLDRQQIEELFDARLVLETSAAERASAHTLELMDPLVRAEDQHAILGDRVIRAAAVGDVPVAVFREYFDADWAFHRVIFENCGNRFLLDLSESLSAHVHRMRQAVLRNHNDVAEALVEHGRIVSAFRSGVPGAATEAMRAHVLNVRSRAVDDASGDSGHDSGGEPVVAGSSL
ncbi:GntR family transcriptional regulator [Frondihabitans sp. PAMC 28766]|uniref:GntR family transcriptional regulator n=1 Tax=Frondihabitans sp. PAMC 28766 TaxID=1795630 RepID=UPI0009EBDCE4|nr:GntR family transcriptional regulator [Frondihabitans sp. PAMC 28766]